MKIIGTEGLSDQDIHFEIQRGARFVVYSYAMSFLVITFRRSSDIHFIKAGQSGVTKGLPYTLLTFVLGWWGIPWGPIYSIASFIQNFKGGRDVTNELMAAVPQAPPPLPI